MTSGPLASDPGAGNFGAFIIVSPEPGWQLVLICDDGTLVESGGWEHVSVRAIRVRQSRTPTWREMAAVKDRLWDAEDVVVQFHPRRSAYVNCHPHVLHLWRHRTADFPTPPANLVG
jgi:hypothetical protein